MISPHALSVSAARIDGAIVLVKSAFDQHDPPIAMRGTLDTHSAPGTVKVVLEFPEMCEIPAHHRAIALNGREVEALLASENEGVYAVTVNEPLDRPPPEVTSRPPETAHPAGSRPR